MPVHDHIHFAVWIGSLTKAIAKQIYRSIEAVVTTNDTGNVQTLRKSRTWIDGFEQPKTLGFRGHLLERSETIARQVYEAFKSELAAKSDGLKISDHTLDQTDGLERPETHGRHGHLLERPEAIARQVYEAFESEPTTKAGGLQTLDHTLGRTDGLLRLGTHECYENKSIDNYLDPNGTVEQVDAHSANESQKQDKAYNTSDLKNQIEVKQDAVIPPDDPTCLEQARDDVLESAAVSKEERCQLASEDKASLRPVQITERDTAPESSSISESGVRLLQHVTGQQSELVRKSDDTSEKDAYQPQNNKHQPEHCELQRTAKQPESSESSCTAHESRAKSPFEDILSKVTFTASPSFKEWAPCTTSDSPRMKLSNVSFHGCEQSGLTLQLSCEFENVRFINCKFNQTTFRHTRLSDVTFSHVEFEDAIFCQVRLKKTTLCNLEFKSSVWRATHLENALVGKDSFVLRQGRKRDYGVQATSVSSKTIRRRIKSITSLRDLKDELRRRRLWDRDIHLLEHAPSGDILTRLSNHENIIDRILQYFLPGSSVHIYEYPQGKSSQAISAKSRKRYVATTLEKSAYYWSYSTTYFGSLQPKTPTLAHQLANVCHRGVGNCTGLLLVNKALYKAAAKRLFGRSFHLQCSAEGAREFLIANRQNMRLVKQLVLYYHWPDEQLAVSPTNNAWRFLLAEIRHQFSFVPNIRLHVGRSFWVHGQWSSGSPSAHVNQNPFLDTDKFAAPADRWLNRGEWSGHRADGTILQIHIEDTDSQEKINFVKGLVDKIEERRVERPLFVRSPQGEEIKYRCAGDFW